MGFYFYIFYRFLFPCNSYTAYWKQEPCYGSNERRTHTQHLKRMLLYLLSYGTKLKKEVMFCPSSWLVNECRFEQNLQWYGFMTWQGLLLLSNLFQSPRRDSNSYSLQKRILSPSCLPFHHRGLHEYYTMRKRVCKNNN